MEFRFGIIWDWRFVFRKLERCINSQIILNILSITTNIAILMHLKIIIWVGVWKLFFTAGKIWILRLFFLQNLKKKN